MGLGSDFGFDVGPAKGPRRVSSRLHRSTREPMFLGVCGGLAESMGVDPTPVRLAFIVGSFFTAIVGGVLVYLALAVILPKDTSLPID
jgi:phage shock protein C